MVLSLRNTCLAWGRSKRKGLAVLGSLVMSIAVVSVVMECDQKGGGLRHRKNLVQCHLNAQMVTASAARGNARRKFARTAWRAG